MSAEGRDDGSRSHAPQACDRALRSALEHFDRVFLVPAHRRMGELLEATVRNDEATAHYERFISLWKDCDVELRPLVNDARARGCTANPFAGSSIRRTRHIQNLRGYRIDPPGLA